MSDMRYDAFISYSHKDMKWGRWIQKKLEHYRLPRQLREEAGDRKSGLHIFRDQTDLAGVELQATLQRELESSRYMIVVCSPASAASKWVNEEIKYFKSLGRTDYIIPFIVEGEPESDDPGKECYPEELRNEGGNRHFLGVNIREIGRNKAFLKLVSILKDVRFDRLADREQLTRRHRTLSATMVILILVAVFFGLLWHNMITARENEKIAEEKARIAEENERIERDKNFFAVWYVLRFINFEKANVTVSEEGLDILIESADAGNVVANSLLGYMYESGRINGHEDPEKAFQYHLRAAEGGFPHSMHMIGYYFMEGYGTEADEQKAFYWFLKSASDDNPDYYQNAAQTGNTEDMPQVGYMLENGIGTEKDEVQAVSWYQRGAETGNIISMYQLARCYRDGIGMDQPDANMAFYWMKKAAEAGDRDCMYYVGMFYQVGYGVEENPREAFLWYRKAADAGDPDAMYWTGWCLENHYGVDSEAEEWYKRAAEAGQSKAVEALERLHPTESTDGSSEP